MANVSVSDVVIIRGAVVINAAKAEKKYEKAPERVRLSLVVRKWAGKLEVLFGTDDKVSKKKPLNVKLDPAVFRRLRSFGLRQGSRCDFELAVGGWSTDRDSGSWYEFLGLIKVDDRDVNYFVYQDEETDNLGSDTFSWEENGYEQEAATAVEEMV
jgi:hypothetical protein